MRRFKKWSGPFESEVVAVLCPVSLKYSFLLFRSSKILHECSLLLPSLGPTFSYECILLILRLVNTNNARFRRHLLQLVASQPSLFKLTALVSILDWINCGVGAAQKFSAREELEDVICTTGNQVSYPSLVHPGPRFHPHSHLRVTVPSTMTLSPI